jgi:ketosteroid isomerase-like protein
MRVLALILVSFILLPVAPAPGQETPRTKLWQRNLAGHPDLVEQAQALSDALVAGDPNAVARQFQPDRVGLVFLAARAPLILYGHEQAQAILRDYLAGRSLAGLHVALARIEAEGDIAQLAFDLSTGRQFGGRAHRERFVACYQLTPEGWRLSRLRCP